MSVLISDMKQAFIVERESGTRRVPTVGPDYSKFDTAADILRDAARWGLLEELRSLLCERPLDENANRLEHYRDVAYELASVKDRNLAVDLLLRVTGVDAFGSVGLRDYGRKHGCSHEHFRELVEEMRVHLRLDPQAEKINSMEVVRHAA